MLRVALTAALVLFSASGAWADITCTITYANSTGHDMKVTASDTGDDKAQTVNVDGSDHQSPYSFTLANGKSATMVTTDSGTFSSCGTEAEIVIGSDKNITRAEMYRNESNIGHSNKCSASGSTKDFTSKYGCECTNSKGAHHDKLQAICSGG